MTIPAANQRTHIGKANHTNQHPQEKSGLWLSVPERLEELLLLALLLGHHARRRLRRRPSSSFVDDVRGGRALPQRLDGEDAGLPRLLVAAAEDAAADLAHKVAHLAVAGVLVGGQQLGGGVRVPAFDGGRGVTTKPGRMEIVKFWLRNGDWNLFPRKVDVL